MATLLPSTSEERTRARERKLPSSPLHFREKTAGGRRVERRGASWAFLGRDNFLREGRTTLWMQWHFVSFDSA